MEQPLFKPEAWVRYEYKDNEIGFGKIIGGFFSDENWNYMITGVSLEPKSIPEDSITHILENNNWTIPISINGSNSAYSNQSVSK